VPDETGDKPPPDADEPLVGSSGPRGPDESGATIPAGDSIVVRQGDPNEFDDQGGTAIVAPDDTSEIRVPVGLLRRLLANPADAPALLAARAVEQLAPRAERDVRLIRERNPTATDRQLAVYFKNKYSRAARWEGAGTGAAGILGLPIDLVALAWIQNRMVLSIAAVYGHDMTDHRDRAAELLILQGIHNARGPAVKAIVEASEKAVAKMVLRHLRKEALVLVKQLFRVVGFKFTRKALLEKGVPLVAVPISAGANQLSTRLLANAAIKFYDTTIA
jgi:hypothetical protein